MQQTKNLLPLKSNTQLYSSVIKIIKVYNINTYMYVKTNIQKSIGLLAIVEPTWMLLGLSSRGKVSRKTKALRPQIAPGLRVFNDHKGTSYQ